MLTLNLQPIFAARGIDKPFTFLTRSGFTNSTATRIINNNFTQLNIRHIELLCKILVCSPSDLFAYSPAKDEILTPDHPLLSLRKDENYKQWQQTWATMPYQQLKDITQQIVENNQNSSDKN